MDNDHLAWENDKVPRAWGKSFLGFNMPHFVKLATEKGTELWPRMVYIDQIFEQKDQIKAMHALLTELSE